MTLSFGDYLRHLRGNVSQKATAYKLNVSIQTLSAWENNHINNLRDRNIKSLSDHYGVPKRFLRYLVAALSPDESSEDSSDETHETPLEAYDCSSLKFVTKHIPPNPIVDLTANWWTLRRDTPQLEIPSDGTLPAIRIPVVSEFESSALPFGMVDLSRLFIEIKSQTSFSLSTDFLSQTQELFDSYLKKQRSILPEAYHPWNGMAIRLCDINVVDGSVVLTGEDIEYFHYLRTNILANYSANHLTSVAELLVPSKTLLPLSSSPFANILGINVLLSTVDGFFVFQKRSHRVMTFPCMLGPSVSGTMSTSHLQGRRCVSDAIIAGEMGEEIALFSQHLDADTWTFLGIGRDLIRAGNPDLYFYVRTRLTYDEVKLRWKSHAPDRSESQDLMPLSALPLVDDRDRDVREVLQWSWMLWQQILPDATPAAQAAFVFFVRHRLRQLSARE